jgi:putative ABC transport system permease protein
MRALTRKLVRDLVRMRSQAAAIAGVVAAGVAVSVLGLCNLETLSQSRARFYDQQRFGDVFVSVKRAPLALARRLGDVPGVAAVEPRIVGQVLLDMPGVAEPVSARMVSMPIGRRPVLNDLVIRSGRALSGGRLEVLVSEPFAAAHRIRPGGSLTAIINNRRRTLTVVGIALSPEFIYAISPGTVFPDDRRFGVLWMGHDELAAAFDLTGAFNDAVIKLAASASAADVIARIDPLVSSFGGPGAFDRGDQMSDWYLEGELSELRTTGRILPYVFAAVAAFLLNIVVSRLIATQREQIGLLKAFGYTSWSIARHYATFSVAVALAGVLVGVPLGVSLGWMLSGLYGQVFHFPELVFLVPASAVVTAAVAAMSVTVAGSLFAVRGALRLPPADAMRPPRPATFRKTIVERLGLSAVLPPWFRIVVRNVERRPLRAVLSITAVAMSVSIMLLGALGDSLEYIVETELEVAQRQSATVTFVEPRPRRVAAELASFDGVLYVEPFRIAAVTFRHGPWSHRGSITGMPASALLARPLDEARHALRLPEDGVVLSDKLARKLHVSRGAELTIEVREGSRPVRSVVVVDTVKDYLGTPAYMNVGALNRVLREGSAISGAHLLTDARFDARLFDRLKETPGVASFFSNRATRQSVRQTIQRSMATSLSFLIAMAGIIAFGVAYNTARVALSERAWELATLRVIGFTRREIGLILLTEVALLVIAAIPLGLILGLGLAHLVSAGYDSEQYRIPAVFNRSSYGFAALVVMAAAAVSGAIVWRLLGRLDLIAVLKTRE